VAAAVDAAEQSPFAASPAPQPLPQPDPVRWQRSVIPNPDRLVNLLHAGLRRALAADDRVLLFGEDIEGPYGGAFKVTKSLSQEFPGRVRNTPISESAIVGVGNGMALQGFVPIVELMFGDFLTLAFDQLLNHASKFRYTYAEGVSVPLIVRTPMGGKRGYGATHSQSIEKHFLGMPDTQVLALHSRIDPGVIYDRLLATIDRPTLVIENKLLYGIRVSDQPPTGFYVEQTNEPFPTARLRPDARAQVTILCYGGMLPDVEKAVDELFDAHDVACEVICPTRLYPFDDRAVAESVAGTGRLVVVEEGVAFAAFGAEVIARLTEGGVRFRARRVGPPEHPIPSSGPLEKSLLPGPAHVVRAVREVMDHV
jgi:2-oxoisovalerate dehydrogenase E1 component